MGGEIWVVITNIVLIIGLAITWKQLRADHARSRKQMAIDYSAAWIRAQNPRTVAAIKLASQLSKESAKALFDSEQFQVPETGRIFIQSVFQRHRESREGITLDAVEVLELRTLVLQFLNELEIVMTAWRNGVADREMIEEEFVFLAAEKNEYKFIMHDFLTQSGMQHYPGITEFIHKQREKRGMPAPGKGYDA